MQLGIVFDLVGASRREGSGQIDFLPAQTDVAISEADSHGIGERVVPAHAHADVENGRFEPSTNDRLSPQTKRVLNRLICREQGNIEKSVDKERRFHVELREELVGRAGFRSKFIFAQKRRFQLDANRPIRQANIEQPLTRNELVHGHFEPDGNVDEQRRVVIGPTKRNRWRVSGLSIGRDRRPGDSKAGRDIDFPIRETLTSGERLHEKNQQTDRNRSDPSGIAPLSCPLEPVPGPSQPNLRVVSVDWRFPLDDRCHTLITLWAILESVWFPARQFHLRLRRRPHWRRKRHRQTHALKNRRDHS